VCDINYLYLNVKQVILNLLNKIKIYVKKKKSQEHIQPVPY